MFPDRGGTADDEAASSQSPNGPSAFFRSLQRGITGIAKRVGSELSSPSDPSVAVSTAETPPAETPIQRWLSVTSNIISSPGRGSTNALPSPSSRPVRSSADPNARPPELSSFALSGFFSSPPTSPTIVTHSQLDLPPIVITGVASEKDVPPTPSQDRGTFLERISSSTSPRSSRPQDSSSQFGSKNLASAFDAVDAPGSGSGSGSGSSRQRDGSELREWLSGAFTPTERGPAARTGSTVNLKSLPLSHSPKDVLARTPDSHLRSHTRSSSVPTSSLDAPRGSETDPLTLPPHHPASRLSAPGALRAREASTSEFASQSSFHLHASLPSLSQLAALSSDRRASESEEERGGERYGSSEREMEMDDDMLLVSIHPSLFDQSFDPVGAMLAELSSGTTPLSRLAAMNRHRMRQLHVASEELVSQVRSHHKEMVKGMEMVTNVERDLQTCHVILKNARHHLASAAREVEDDLSVAACVGTRRLITAIIPSLQLMLHASEMKARLQSLVDLSDVAVALQLCSQLLSVIEHNRQLRALEDMSRWIEMWLTRTLARIDSILSSTCRRFNAESFTIVLEAYSVMDEAASLAEKVPTAFLQALESDTFDILLQCVEQACTIDDSRRAKLAYTDLCLQLPPRFFLLCLARTLELMFEFLCSFHAMLTWKHPLEVAASTAAGQPKDRSMEGTEFQPSTPTIEAQPSATAERSNTGQSSSISSGGVATHSSAQPDRLEDAPFHRATLRTGMPATATESTILSATMINEKDPPATCRARARDSNWEVGDITRSHCSSELIEGSSPSPADVAPRDSAGGASSECGKGSGEAGGGEVMASECDQQQDHKQQLHQLQQEHKQQGERQRQEQQQGEQQGEQQEGHDHGSTLSGKSVDECRLEAVRAVRTALQAGKRGVWELSCRRLASLMAAPQLKSSSSHLFVDAISLTHRFIRAGEAFVGSESVSLRVKLAHHSLAFFSAYHLQAMELLRGLFEKESWQQLPPSSFPLQPSSRSPSPSSPSSSSHNLPTTSQPSLNSLPTHSNHHNHNQQQQQQHKRSNLPLSASVFPHSRSVGSPGEGFTVWAAKNSLFEGMSSEGGAKKGRGVGDSDIHGSSDTDDGGKGGDEGEGRGLGGVLLAAGTAPTMSEEIVRVMREGGKGERERRSVREDEGRVTAPTSSLDVSQAPHNDTQPSSALSAQPQEVLDSGNSFPGALLGGTPHKERDHADGQVEQEGNEEEASEEEEDSEELMADFIDEEGNGSVSHLNSISTSTATTTTSSISSSGRKNQKCASRRSGGVTGAGADNSRTAEVVPVSDKSMGDCRSASWTERGRVREGGGGSQLGKSFDRWHLGIGPEGVHPVASLVCCARLVEHYSDMVKQLPAVTEDAMEAVCQLFDLVLLSVFRLFGSRAAIPVLRSSDKQHEQIIPPRLRAVLSRGLKRLEELHVRPLAPPPLSESAAATASVTLKSVVREALSSLPPLSSPQLVTARHAAPGQLALSPGKVLAGGGGSFGQDFSSSSAGGSSTVSAGHLAIVSTSGLLGASGGLATLKERAASVESLFWFSDFLRASQPRLNALLLRPANVALTTLFSQTLDAVPELAEHVLQTAVVQLLHYTGYADRIASVKYDVRPYDIQHSSYVDDLMTEFRLFMQRMARSGVTQQVHDLLVYYAIETVADVLVEGLSRVKRCSNEGRALMSLDLQVLTAQIQQLTRAKPNLQKVEAYIKAYYLPETEYTYWAVSHPEYSKNQILGLINLVASTNNWKRKTRLEILERLGEA